MSLGDIADDGATTVRIYWKPLVTLIWLGAIVMAFGGLLSLSDRRLRVGAPRPAAPRRSPAAGGMRRCGALFAVALSRLRRRSSARRLAVDARRDAEATRRSRRARGRCRPELRCLVCQNQSIDDSDAPLAHDLRVLLRERIAAGDSDQAAVEFLVARYGEFILLKPPRQRPHAAAVDRAVRGASDRRRRDSLCRPAEALGGPPAPDLSAAESEKLARIVDGEGAESR